MAKNIIYTVTLSYGETFTIAGSKFSKNRPQNVSKNLFDYLKKAESCQTSIMVDGKAEARNKFTFEQVEETVEAQKPQQ
jgi:hypothetical protein